MSGKSGANGPTATPLARVLEKSELELARLPCSKATTVSATQLRRLRALRPVQVDFFTFLVLMVDSMKLRKTFSNIITDEHSHHQ